MEFLLTHFQTFEISHLLIMVDRFVLCRSNIAVKCTLGGANKQLFLLLFARVRRWAVVKTYLTVY